MEETIHLTPEWRAKLFPYQVESIEMLSNKLKGRGILGLPCGMGKTPVMIEQAIRYGGNVLFIVMKAKFRDIIRDGKNMGGIDIVPIEKKTKRMKMDDATERPRYQIVTFDMGKRMREVYEGTWDTVIVDEAHYLKGADSDVAEKLIPVVQRAKHIILVTATPMPARPSDLYNQLFALDPRAFPSRQDFSAKYNEGKLNPMGVWEEGKASNLDELHDVLSQYMHRIPRPVDPEKPSTRHIIRFNVDMSVMPHALKGKYEATRLCRETNRAKQPFLWPLALEKLREIPDGQSGVFFFKHKDIAKSFRDYLIEHGFDPVYADGDISVGKRDEVVASCRSGDARCGVMTMNSCGTGLNMTPGVTHIFLMELDFAYALLEQCEGRGTRADQIWPVHCFWFIARGTFDETTYGCAIAKSKNEEKTYGTKTTHKGIKPYFQKKWQQQ